ncbi:MAG: adenosylcobinamide-GDP ribazoletransferase [Myxococcales bacterium FL481]|nr:MAG: adenosylcobinamide-GDP ribazoletransferase [Myxococcales bacterium FL481]
MRPNVRGPDRSGSTSMCTVSSASPSGGSAAPGRGVSASDGCGAGGRRLTAWGSAHPENNHTALAARVAIGRKGSNSAESADRRVGLQATKAASACSATASSRCSSGMRRLRFALTAFAHAVMLLTRVPLGRVPGDRHAMRVSAVFHPLVGALIGASGAIAYAMWHGLGLPGAGLAAVFVTIVVTGALHEDGLADCADGFFGARHRADVLRIMKDPRVGTYGVLALIGSVGLRWQLIAALPVEEVLGWLVGVHALARVAPLYLMSVLPYIVQSTSKSSGTAAGLHAHEAGVGVAIGAVVAWWWCPVGAGWSLLAVGALAAGFAGFLRRRLGGYTGDCLGAVEQLGEISVLLVAQAVRHGAT